MPGLLKALRLLFRWQTAFRMFASSNAKNSVAELQEILAMGQSRISMALSQLRQAKLIELRRAGRKSLYRFSGDEDRTANLLRQSALELAEARDDDKPSA